MHIDDGVLPAPVLLAGAVSAIGLTAVTLRSLLDEDVPKTAVLTAAFFVASHLRFPVGPTSVHLTLIGLMGVVLGRASFIAVAVGVFLQAALFKHGGLTALGVNMTTMGSGALVASWVFSLRGAGVVPRRDARYAAAAAAVGTFAALLLYGGAVLSAGYALRHLAEYVFILHLPVVVLETLIAAAAVRFLARVEPRLLRRPGEGVALGPPGPTPSQPATRPPAGSDGDVLPRPEDHP